KRVPRGDTALVTKRMVEESSDKLERALLRSVRRDAMSDRSRRRVLAGLGIAGAVVTTTSTAASSLAAGKMGLFKGTSAVVAKWGAVSALVTLVPAGAWVAHSHLRRPDVVAVEKALPAPVEAKLAPKDPTSELAVARPIAPAPEGAPAPARPTRDAKAAP